MIHIRTAKAVEWPLLVDIYVRENLPDEVALVSKEAEKEFQEIGRNRTIWFAEDDGVVVGSIQLVRTHTNEQLANGTNRGLVHHLRVSYSHHGQKIGSQLYSALEREAQALGIRTLMLEVEITNTAAQQIYTHWGYTIVGEGNDPTELVMKKNIERKQ